MAELTTLKEGVDGWRNAALIKDEDSGAHYIVSTITTPWNPQPESLVYPTDDNGQPDPSFEHDATTHGKDFFVAGGLGMDRDEALADLSARIDEGRLLTREEATEQANRELEEDFNVFMQFIGAQAPQEAEATA